MLSTIASSCRAAVVAALVLLPGAGLAQEILTIEAPGKSESFSFDDLAALPQTTVVTANDYVNDAVAFTGPSLKSLLERVGVGREATLTARALNDFSVNIPASDAFDYEVVVAILADGKPMPVRDKGPIWVIYPMDDHPELRTNIYNSRLIWQLRSITVR